VQQTHA